MTAVLPEGKHKFSGIDPYTRSSDYWNNREGYYIVIDNIVYAFECDPDDGYRSYGNIYIPENISVYDIKNRFLAQDVIITQHHREHTDENKHFYSITDAETGKTILEIGTDYTDDYYPMAICHYYPENMAINQHHSNMVNTSDNNYTNEWVITSVEVSEDFNYHVDENIIYMYN